MGTHVKIMECGLLLIWCRGGRNCRTLSAFSYALRKYYFGCPLSELSKISQLLLDLLKESRVLKIDRARQICLNVGHKPTASSNSTQLKHVISLYPCVPTPLFFVADDGSNVSNQNRGGLKLWFQKPNYSTNSITDISDFRKSTELISFAFP